MPVSSSKRRPTIADVAKLAGVSKMAVSATLNRGCGKTTHISEKTAKLIRDAAVSLGYRTNLSAQALVTGRTGFIGFMLASSVRNGFMNSYFASFLQGAESECRRRGYGLAISCAPFSEAGDFINSNILSRRRIDALIVAGEIDSDVYKELKLSEIPFIVLNAMPRTDIPTLGTPGQHTVFRLIARSGHRKVISTVNAGISANDLAAYRALAKNLCPKAEIEFFTPEPAQHPNWEPGVGLGRHLFAHWLSKPPAERATLIVSNGILPEFYSELVNAGRKCPEEVSLLGDNALDDCLFPEFARIRGPHQRVGADAVAILESAIEGGGSVNLVEVCRIKAYQSCYVPGSTFKELKP